MRRLLVKRFESSFHAFEKSIKNFKEITQNVLSFIERTGKYILDRDLLLKIYEESDEVIEEALLKYSEKIKKDEHPKNEKIYEINRFKSKDQFLKDIQSDLELFDFILKELEALKLTENDPKVACLISKIQESLKKDPKRKIVIFSEYIDTVKHLENITKKIFNDRVLTVAGDLTASKIIEIYKNFDASYKDKEDKYDILITTDKISEGFNLNRAGMVVNYDIPWNPVRVIQRLGRINRISKKVFDKLYIVNFFPTEKGADLVRSREIARNKMFLIHNTLGEDSKIFDIDEEPSPSELYTRLQKNPEEIEKESLITKIIKEFEEIKEKYPQLIKELENFPKRIKVAKKGEEKELFVLIKKGKIHIHHKKYDLQENNHFLVSLEEIIDKIKADYHDKPLPLSDRFWEAYEEIKNYNDTYKTTNSEVSIEQKAKNILKSLLRSEDSKEIFELKPFIETLLEDILDYGTLSDYTLRRIASINSKDKAISVLKALKNELGEDYLQKEKERLKDLKKEIIIAIENQKI